MSFYQSKLIPVFSLILALGIGGCSKSKSKDEGVKIQAAACTHPAPLSAQSADWAEINVSDIADGSQGNYVLSGGTYTVTVNMPNGQRPSATLEFALDENDPENADAEINVECLDLGDLQKLDLSIEPMVTISLADGMFDVQREMTVNASAIDTDQPDADEVVNFDAHIDISQRLIRKRERELFIEPKELEMMKAEGAVLTVRILEDREMDFSFSSTDEEAEGSGVTFTREVHLRYKLVH